MKISISILGSTGSIGLNSLFIINKQRKNFNVNLLSANKNYRLISKQIKKYNPNYFVITDKEIFKKIKIKFKNKKTKILNDFEFKRLKKNLILQFQQYQELQDYHRHYK